MPEWLLVALAGALGALVTDYYQQRGLQHGIPRTGFAIPWVFIDDDGIHRFDPGVLASPFIGCIAALITVLSVDASILASPSIHWNSALGAFLAGIASDAFLKRIVREAQRQEQNRQRLEEIGRTVEDKVDTLLPDVESVATSNDATKPQT